MRKSFQLPAQAKKGCTAQLHAGTVAHVHPSDSSGKLLAGNGIEAGANESWHWQSGNEMLPWRPFFVEDPTEKKVPTPHPLPLALPGAGAQRQVCVAPGTPRETEKERAARE